MNPEDRISPYIYTSLIKDVRDLRNRDFSVWYNNIYLKSKHWLIVRKRLLKDVKYRCEKCSLTNTVLNCHHLNYKRLGEELRSDLIVLCEDCHLKAHKKEKNMKKPVLVAELCCNHCGDIDLAKKMIDAAANSGAEYIKLQKRTPEISVPKNLQDKPHPNSHNSFGNNYLEHRKNLELSIEEHYKLKEYTTSRKIKYSCSVWDPVSLKEIIDLNPEYIKIPSALNLNFNLIDKVFEWFSGQVHISTGMISRDEKRCLYKYLNDKKDRVVIYHTTSGYPVTFKELYLLEISELKEIFPVVGYSGHHLGIAADIAAYTLGATWIERHFTLDRTLKGTDQAASLEPQGLSKLHRDLAAVQEALRMKNDYITDDERKNRDKLQVKYFSQP